MGFFTLTRAITYDESGEELDRKTFSIKKKTFRIGERSYNVNLKDGSYFTLTGVIWNTRYYHYPYDNPDPFKFDKKVEPIMDSHLYNTQLENKVARDLNRLNDKGIFGNMNVLYVLLGIVAVFIFGFMIIKEFIK